MSYVHKFALANSVAGLAFLTALLLCPHAGLAQTSDTTTGTAFKVEVISNLIIMPGYINDSPRLDVALDTVPSVNILAPELAAELKLKPTTSSTAQGIGKGEVQSLHHFEGVQLAWGPDKKVKLGDQQVAALPIAYISQQTGHPVDAIFGNSLFQNFKIRVDYEQGAVTFLRGGALPAAAASIPLTINGGVPFVTATLETASGEKVPALFIVDSGTTGAMLLSRKFLEAHPAIAAGHPYVDMPSMKAVGGTIEFQLLRITGVDLGPFHLSAPIAIVPREVAGVLAMPDLAGFIGAGILSRFTVDWDYEHKTMSLTPNHRYADPFDGDASGLRLVAEGPEWKTIKVAAVDPGSPAAEAGLETGDVLQTLNGKPLPPLYEVAKLLTHPGSAVAMTILHSGKRKTVTLHLRRLV